MNPANTSPRWFRRLHPAIIAFSYTGFVFFGGFWNWVFRGYNNTVLAASISAGVLLAPSLMCLSIQRQRRLGLAGIYLGATICAIISGIYAWRAYVALFEQSNVPKTILISIQVCLGIVACVLLLVNHNIVHRNDHAIATTTL